jgi:hypothetical protein
VREVRAVAALVAIAAIVASVAVVACSRGRTPTAEPAAAAAEPLSSAPGADASGAGKPFGSPCLGDVECSGGVCFHKRVKGPDAGHERRGADEAVEHDGYCSMRCDDDSQCPVPPTKGRCGARGMCKRPD